MHPEDVIIGLLTRLMDGTGVDKKLPGRKCSEAPGKEAAKSINPNMSLYYGFGWAVGEIKGAGKIVNHSGGWPGYSTYIERNIENDKTIIILRNHEAPGEVLKKTRQVLYDLSR